MSSLRRGQARHRPGARRDSVRAERDRHHGRPRAGGFVPPAHPRGGGGRRAGVHVLRPSGRASPASRRPLTGVTKSGPGSGTVPSAPGDPPGYALLQAMNSRLATATLDETRISPEERLTVGVAARLSQYLRVLTQAKKMGKERISSQEISEYTNINATQIRRDLSGFGKFGKRGVGYTVDGLAGEIRKILRTQGQHNIALVGAGRLGQAIASSPIFAEHGINIAAVFDRDPDMIGRPVGPNAGSVLDSKTLTDVVRDKNIIVGVIAVPAGSAQQAADELVDSGVRIIFNYSEALLDVPHDVQVHTSNPAVELLHALYFHLA